MNSQQLSVSTGPAQDQVSQHPSTVWKEVHDPTPLTGEPRMAPGEERVSAFYVYGPS